MPTVSLRAVSATPIEAPLITVGTPLIITRSFALNANPIPSPDTFKGILLDKNFLPAPVINLSAGVAIIPKAPAAISSEALYSS